MEERRLPPAVLAQGPQRDFLLLTKAEMKAIEEMAKEEFPYQNPLALLERDELERFLRLAAKDRLIPKKEPSLSKEERLHLEKQARHYADDIKQVTKGGKIRLFIGEGTHELYYQPSIREAIEEARERRITIQVSAGPFLSAANKNYRKEAAVLEYAQEGWIQLYRRPVRGLARHFAVLETEEGLKVRLEETHVPGASSKDRKMVKFSSAKEENRAGTVLAKLFDESIADKRRGKEDRALRFDSEATALEAVTYMWQRGIILRPAPGHCYIAKSDVVEELLERFKGRVEEVKLVDLIELTPEEQKEVRKRLARSK